MFAVVWKGKFEVVTQALSQAMALFPISPPLKWLELNINRLRCCRLKLKSPDTVPKPTAQDYNDVPLARSDLFITFVTLCYLTMLSTSPVKGRQNSPRLHGMQAASPFPLVPKGHQGGGLNIHTAKP